MKKIAFLLMACLLFFSCEVIEEDPGEQCGEHHESQDASAPTTVKDSEATYFYFYVDDTYVPEGTIVVKAQQKMDAGEISKDKFTMNIGYSQYGLWREFMFDIGREEMKALGAALAESPMMKENGYTSYTDGIPPDSGTYVLRANFVSGEAYDFVINAGIWGSAYEAGKTWMEVVYAAMEKAGLDPQPVRDIYTPENSWQDEEEKWETWEEIDPSEENSPDESSKTNSLSRGT